MYLYLYIHLYLYLYLDICLHKYTCMYRLPQAPPSSQRLFRRPWLPRLPPRLPGSLSRSTRPRTLRPEPFNFFFFSPPSFPAQNLEKPMKTNEKPMKIDSPGSPRPPQAPQPPPRLRLPRLAPSPAVHGRKPIKINPTGSPRFPLNPQALRGCHKLSRLPKLPGILLRLPPGSLSPSTEIDSFLMNTNSNN